MRIIQSRSFERKVKRFSEAEKKILDRQIKKILENPAIGQGKKGDLRGVYIYKFRMQTIQP